MPRELAHRRHHVSDQVADVVLGALPDLWSRAESPLSPAAVPAVRSAWQSLCDVGVGGLLVPVELGGQGGGLVDALAVAGELSRLPAPLPFLSSAVLATRLAHRMGATSLLAELATGDAVVAIAAGGVLRQEGNSWLLSGLITDVLHGADADCWLVCTPDTNGISLTLLTRPAVELLPDPDGTRPVVRALLSNHPVALLGRSTRLDVQECLDQAALVRCAEAIAAARFVLRHDDTAVPLVHAAEVAVEHAAAEFDVNGGPVAGLPSTERWSCRVAQLVSRTTYEGDRRAALCAMRATGSRAWLPRL